MEGLIVSNFHKKKAYPKEAVSESCEWVSYISNFTDIDDDTDNTNILIPIMAPLKNGMN